MPSHPPTDRPPRGADAHARILPGLQLLRGWAALSVAFLHITNQAGVLVGRPEGPAYPWLRPFPFDAGVDVFFAISGFVMVWSSQPLFGRAGAARVFVGRRLSRVVPLYWVVTTVLLLLVLALPSAVNEAPPSAALVVSSYLFLPWRRADGAIQPLFTLGWTLNYEMMFYAVFAAFVPLRARVAVPCVVSAVCGLAALGVLLQPRPAALAFWTDPIILEFAAGAALAALARRWRLPGPARVALAGLGLAGLWAADRSGWPHALSYTPPCVALVAAAALGRRGSVPDARLAIAWGDVSYALYLVHPFPMRAAALVWARAGWAGSVAGVIGFVVSALTASVLLAWVVHAFVERPLTRAARRLWTRETALAF